MRRLQFDEDQRQAVDEADQVGAALVHLAGDPELRGEEEVVVLRLVPVDDADGLGDLLAFRAANGDPDAVLQQLVDLPVGVGGAQGAAIAGQLLDGLFDGLRR